jgi:hypothetical protein
MNKPKALVLAAVGGAGVGWLVWRLKRRHLRLARRADPVITDLLAEHAGRIDFADAWAAPIAEGESDDPKLWAGAVLDLPPAVNKLIRVRDALARWFGLATMTGQDFPPTGFPLLAEGDCEVVLGVDDDHLDFRLGITTRNNQAVFTTTVTVNNRLGACYWALVRLFHPFVVATALRRARL